MYTQPTNTGSRLALYAKTARAKACTTLKACMAATAIVLSWPPSSAVAQTEPADAVSPFAEFTRDWRDDRAWYDGNAEIAEYQATRTIYGQPRAYQATIMTNKELADPVTKTKAATNAGREVFKHHTREDIPTEKYDYHFSTMVYVGTSDLKSLKIDMGSQEDCGATFKQFVNHAGQLRWHQHSYFPNQGTTQGYRTPLATLVFQDALSVVLRGYPFENPQPFLIHLIEDQTTNKWSSTAALPYTITYRGLETIDVPMGAIEAHRLTLSPLEDDGKHPVMDYWFDQRQEAPWLGVMIQHRGPHGVTYKIESLRREAYWR